MGDVVGEMLIDLSAVLGACRVYILTARVSMQTTRTDWGFLFWIEKQLNSRLFVRVFAIRVAKCCGATQTR